MGSSSFSQAQEHLRDVEYPASKAEVIDSAEDGGADRQLLDTMRDELPDAIFDSPEDVKRALGDSL